MSILEAELAADQAIGSRCHICVWISRQPIEVQEEWHTAFAKPSEVVSHASLLRALERRSVETSEGAVKRHRRNHS